MFMLMLFCRNCDTLTHLLKASLGSGILSMPLAFKYTGLAMGIVYTIIVAIICTHCAYILVSFLILLVFKYWMISCYCKIVTIKFYFRWNVHMLYTTAQEHQQWVLQKLVKSHARKDLNGLKNMENWWSKFFFLMFLNFKSIDYLQFTTLFFSGPQFWAVCLLHILAPAVCTLSSLQEILKLWVFMSVLLRISDFVFNLASYSKQAGHFYLFNRLLTFMLNQLNFVSI